MEDVRLRTETQIFSSGSWPSGRFAIALAFVVSLMSLLSAAQASGGATVFKNKCVLCHGADGSGNTTLGKQLQAANLRSKDVQKKTDAEMHKVIHDGNGNMPPFGEQLSETEITQLVHFVRGLGKVAKK